MGYEDFTWYKGQLAWLPARTIFLARHGSQAYGTALPTSDTDLKGVAIPPREYFLGYLQRFEQAESKEPDAVVYDIRKFVSLAAACNPNIIEMLFVDEDAVLVARPAWERLRDARDMFLSQRAQHTFSGYAMAQFKRINTHRRWLLTPPKAQPTRAEFGLPEATTIGKEQLGVIEARIRKIEDTLGGTGLTKDLVAEREEELVTQATADLSPNLIPIVLAERRYGAAMRNWSQYTKWREERNPARAELEARFGYDTKHAMHLVRLLRMGVEILSGKGVIVRRPDAEELLEIRRGAWSYEKLMAFAILTDERLKILAQHSPLPREPRAHEIDKLVVSVVAQYLGPQPA